jgi:hypothetical protein
MAMFMVRVVTTINLEFFFAFANKDIGNDSTAGIMGAVVFLYINTLTSKSKAYIYTMNLA